MVFNSNIISVTIDRQSEYGKVALLDLGQALLTHHAPVHKAPTAGSHLASYTPHRQFAQSPLLGLVQPLCHEDVAGVEKPPGQESGEQISPRRLSVSASLVQSIDAKSSPDKPTNKTLVLDLWDDRGFDPIRSRSPEFGTLLVFLSPYSF